jgi:hypothetical protein
MKRVSVVLKHATAKSVAGCQHTKSVTLATSNAVKASLATAKNVTAAQAVVSAVQFQVKKFAPNNQAVACVAASLVLASAAQFQVKKFVRSPLLLASSAEPSQMVVKNAARSLVVTQFVPAVVTAKNVLMVHHVKNVTLNQVSAFVLAAMIAKSATTFQVKTSAVQFLTKIKSVQAFLFLTATPFQVKTFVNRSLTKKTSAVT